MIGFSCLLLLYDFSVYRPSDNRLEPLALICPHITCWFPSSLRMLFVVFASPPLPLYTILTFPFLLPFRPTSSPLFAFLFPSRSHFSLSAARSSLLWACFLLGFGIAWSGPLLFATVFPASFLCCIGRSFPLFRPWGPLCSLLSQRCPASSRLVTAHAPDASCRRFFLPDCLLKLFLPCEIILLYPSVSFKPVKSPNKWSVTSGQKKNIDVFRIYGF